MGQIISVINNYAVGSQGMFVEVYVEKFMIKGHDFTKNQWIDEYTHSIGYGE